jgi:hypothetical protein
MYGLERSFLEAEYHCYAGHKLIKKAKQKAKQPNKNLVCRKRRWIGMKPACVQQQPQQQQCDSDEAQKCEQLCTRRSGNRTEATCHCHKGFRLIGTRCIGK